MDQLVVRMIAPQMTGAVYKPSDVESYDVAGNSSNEECRY